MFDLGGRRVVEVMTPRDMIFSLPIDTSPELLAIEVARGHFSRVPIYQGTPTISWESSMPRTSRGGAWTGLPPGSSA